MEPNQQLACPHCGGLIAVCEEMLGKTGACDHCAQPVAFAQPGAVQGTMSAQETYNVVTDLGVGPNLRLKDNLIQLAAILVVTAVGVVVGMLVVDERAAGAVVGGFIGLLVGLLGSGVFLMIYRLIRHATGHHE